MSPLEGDLHTVRVNVLVRVRVRVPVTEGDSDSCRTWLGVISGFSQA